MESMCLKINDRKHSQRKPFSQQALRLSSVTSVANDSNLLINEDHGTTVLSRDIVPRGHFWLPWPLGAVSMSSLGSRPAGVPQAPTDIYSKLFIVTWGQGLTLVYYINKIWFYSFFCFLFFVFNSVDPNKGPELRTLRIKTRAELKRQMHTTEPPGCPWFYGIWTYALFSRNTATR